MNPDYDIHKICIVVTHEKFVRVQNLVPHGLKSKLMNVIIDDMCNAIDREGHAIFGALLSKSEKRLDFSKLSPVLQGKGEPLYKDKYEALLEKYEALLGDHVKLALSKGVQI
jgi:hypothetical protein